MYPCIFHKAIFAYHKAMTLSVETLLLKGISATDIWTEGSKPQKEKRFGKF